MFTYLECYSAGDLLFFINNYTIKNKKEYMELKKILKKYDGKHNTKMYKEMKLKLCKDKDDRKCSNEKNNLGFIEERYVENSNFDISSKDNDFNRDNSNRDDVSSRDNEFSSRDVSSKDSLSASTLTENSLEGGNGVRHDMVVTSLEIDDDKIIKNGNNYNIEIKDGNNYNIEIEDRITNDNNDDNEDSNGNNDIDDNNDRKNTTNNITNNTTNNRNRNKNIKYKYYKVKDSSLLKKLKTYENEYKKNNKFDKTDSSKDSKQYNEMEEKISNNNFKRTEKVSNNNFERTEEKVSNNNFKRITEIYLSNDKNNILTAAKEIIRIKYNDKRNIAKVEILNICCNGILSGSECIDDYEAYINNCNVDNCNINNCNVDKCNKYCICNCNNNGNNDTNNNNTNINNRIKNIKENVIVLPKNKIKNIFTKEKCNFIIKNKHNNREYSNREYNNRESEIYKRIHKLIKDNELYSFTKIKYKRIKIEKDTENHNIFYYDIKIEREHRYKRLKEIIIKTKENMNYERINILAYFIAKSKDYKFNNKKHILIHESSRGDDSINNRNTGNNRVIRYKQSRNTSSKESNSNSNNDRIITIPIRVEPKVFFANERTFLSWLQFAIFNGTIGICIFCLSDGTKGNTGEVCGFILIMVSIIFAIYALYLYFYRVGLIRRRRVNYDNLYGPVVLTVVFISAMIFCVLYKLDEN